MFFYLFVRAPFINLRCKQIYYSFTFTYAVRMRFANLADTFYEVLLYYWSLCQYLLKMVWVNNDFILLWHSFKPLDTRWRWNVVISINLYFGLTIDCNVGVSSDRKLWGKNIKIDVLIENYMIWWWNLNLWCSINAKSQIIFIYNRNRE